MERELWHLALRPIQLQRIGIGFLSYQFGSARINFVLFVFVVIFFIETSKPLNLYRRFILFLCSFFIGGLFYLTIWFQHGFGIEWLTAVTPNNQGFIGLTARFIYKTIISITIISFIFIIFNFYTILKKEILISLMYII